jgi:TetR/AcrR family transcriptional repressor of mexJK operon
MLDEDIPPQRSRRAPHPARKTEQVVAAAKALFLEHGFMETSMDAIARRAAVSKATLYAYFQTKEALFASLIEAECETVDDGFVMPDLALGLMAALRAFGMGYVSVFMDGSTAAFFSVIAAENGRFPDLCALFVKSGPQKAVSRCAELLTTARDNGLLDFPDAEMAATHFLSLVRGDMPLHAALGVRLQFTDAVERMIERGIDVFLRAYGVDLPRI